MASVDIRILGDAKLSSALLKLENNVQKKLLRKAMRPAIKIIKKRAEGNISRSKEKEGGKHLKDTLKIRAISRKKRRKGVVGLSIVTGTREALGLSSDSKKDFYYPSAVELGYTTRGGKKIKGQRNIIRAVEQVGDKTKAKLASELWSQIRKSIK